MTMFFKTFWGAAALIFAAALGMGVQPAAASPLTSAMSGGHARTVEQTSDIHLVKRKARPSGRYANGTNSSRYNERPPQRRSAKKGPPPKRYAKKGPPPRYSAKKSPPPRRYAKKGPPPRYSAKKGPPPKRYAKKGPPPRRYGKRYRGPYYRGPYYRYPYPYYGFGFGYYPAPYYYGAPYAYRRPAKRAVCRPLGVGTPAWIRCCSRKYRSFNPKTGLYTAYSGKKRQCY